MLHVVNGSYQLSINQSGMYEPFHWGIPNIIIRSFGGPGKISQRGFFRSYAFWKEEEAEGLDGHFCQGSQLDLISHDLHLPSLENKALVFCWSGTMEGIAQPCGRKKPGDIWLFLKQPLN